MTRSIESWQPLRALQRWLHRMLWTLSSSAGPDLESWVRRAQGSGSAGRAAFDHIVHTESPWLLRYLRSLLGDRGLADDAAQQTWLRAYLSLGKLKEPSAFRGWIRQIATRTAFNLRRDRLTRDRYEQQAPSPTLAPDDGEAVDAEEALLASLDKLSYPYREILVLRYVEDLDMREIQTLLDLGPSAAKMRLKRARDAFRSAYQEVTHAEGP